jgi:predicted nuclease of predicted toxin-antitoxin system
VRRLLPDQGMPRSTAVLLTVAGRDVIHVRDSGMSRVDDVDIVQRALAEARADL